MDDSGSVWMGILLILLFCVSPHLAMIIFAAAIGYYVFIELIGGLFR